MGKFDAMELELRQLLKRDVDVVDWNGVEQSENQSRKRRILDAARVIYAE